MRRHDRQIKDKIKLIEILDNAVVCRIALNDNPFPYIVPMNFGYQWDHTLELFFHSAPEGRKIDLLKKNPNAGFEIDIGHELVQKEKPCDWGMKYKSIVGHGSIEILTDCNMKIAGLDLLMRHYKYKETIIKYDESMLKHTTVLKLTVADITGKMKE